MNQLRLLKSRACHVRGSSFPCTMTRENHSQMCAKRYEFHDTNSIFHDNNVHTNPVCRKSSRHIDMRVHYCRELYTAGVMKLIPLRTHLMVADALTKSLPGPALSKHRDIMMGHMPFFARLLHCGSQPFYSRFLHSA